MIKALVLIVIFMFTSVFIWGCNIDKNATLGTAKKDSEVVKANTITENKIINKNNLVDANNKGYETDLKTYSKPSDEEIKEMLTDSQYKVTQEESTERPFNNEYWDNHEEGIYVDVVSGEPLFSSTDKYDSGTGWPSFTKPIEKANIVEKKDNSFISTRTEIRSKYGDSHIGHVFDDGPKEEGGLRYCTNSAALRFVPKNNLKEEGYEDYLYLFGDA